MSDKFDELAKGLALSGKHRQARRSGTAVVLPATKSERAISYRS